MFNAVKQLEMEFPKPAHYVELKFPDDEVFAMILLELGAPNFGDLHELQEYWPKLNEAMVKYVRWGSTGRVTVPPISSPALSYRDLKELRFRFVDYMHEQRNLGIGTRPTAGDIETLTRLW